MKRKRFWSVSYSYKGSEVDTHYVTDDTKDALDVKREFEEGKTGLKIKNVNRECSNFKELGED
jgi:hypothetical protein